MVLRRRYAALGLGRKRRTRRKMKGRGFGDFLSSGLAGLGTGLGRGVSGLLGNLFGGRRKPVKRVRRVRRIRGRGVLGDINQLAKETQVVSKALNKFGPGWLGDAAARLGYGRKRGRGYRTIVW